jgi:hypothetical protein
MVAVLVPSVALADSSISPETVDELVFPGESVDVAKTVGTPDVPPRVDVCLLQDESFSALDDIGNLQNPVTIVEIFDGVRAWAPDSQFGVTGFRDYERSPFGSSGDWVYRLLSSMSPDFAAWEAGVNALVAGGGADIPEAQYDAIVAAAGPGPTDYEPDPVALQGDCGWRDDADTSRVLVVTTDAPFHTPDGTHQHDVASTTAALLAANVTVVGLKADGASTELDDLAAATGGSVQALSPDGSNIAEAILAGLSNLQVEVALVSDCDAPISTVFTPPMVTVTSGGDALFTETIGVDVGAAGGTYTCTDQVTYDGTLVDLFETKTIHVPGISLDPEFAINPLVAGTSHTVTATVLAGDFGAVAGVPVEFEIVGGPNAGITGSGVTDAEGEVDFTWSPGDITPDFIGTDSVVASFTNADGSVVYGRDLATKEWIDAAAPEGACLESVNPSGKHEPSAPGKGNQGQNQDGFYELDGSDEVWPDDVLEFFVRDGESGTVFGPFAIGTVIKWTEANGVTPKIKAMAGHNSAVDWHIIANGDAEVVVVDGAGNTSDPAACLVPPEPK